MKAQLRPYQQEAVDAIIKSANIDNIKRQVIVMATGTGKTFVFGQLPPLIKKRGKKTLVLAHREELLDQAKKELLSIDPTLKVEIEQGERTVDNPDTDVIIASVPTIGRTNSKRIEKFNPDEFGLIVIKLYINSIFTKKSLSKQFFPEISQKHLNYNRFFH